jgi:GTPase SAR1 family protein
MSGIFQSIAESIFGVTIHTDESVRVTPATPSHGQHQGPRIWRVDNEVREQLAKGVKYNMRLVLRGARGTGKTAMLERLQGHPVPLQYVPTGSIQASTIRWVPKTSKASEDEEVVKIDVWDVVDKGSIPTSQGSSSSGNVGNGPANIPQMPVDASTVDVYRGTHCVVFMVDITRPETLQYVETEARNVPVDCLILVCVNFYDLHQKRTVSEEAIERVCKSIRRSCTPFIASVTQAKPDEGVSVGATWLYTSMVTGFGMRPLYTYLNTPFNYLRIKTHEEEMRSMYAAISKLNGEFYEIRQRQNFEEYLRWTMHVESVRDGVPVEETQAAQQRYAHPFNRALLSELTTAAPASAAPGVNGDGIASAVGGPQRLAEEREGYHFVEEDAAPRPGRAVRTSRHQQRTDKHDVKEKEKRPSMKDKVKPDAKGVASAKSTPVGSLDDLFPSTIDDSFFSGEQSPASNHAPTSPKVPQASSVAEPAEDFVEEQMAAAEQWIPNPVVNERALKTVPQVDGRLVDDAVALLKNSFGEAELVSSPPSAGTLVAADAPADKKKKRHHKDKGSKKDKAEGKS